MTALKRLRVFQCRQGLPLNLQSTMSLHRSRRLGLRFERAMFPRQSPALAMYALHLNPDTRVELFDTVPPHALVDLRLSGELVAPPGKPAFAPVPALRHLTLHTITGTFFDRHALDELSSGVITRCLKSLPRLEHFALHLVTVDELRSNFVLALPPSLSVFKLQVVNAWYAIPLRDEERGLCDAIEKVVLLRDRPFEHVCVCFREQLLTEDGRRERWLRIAEERGLKLNIGPWGSQMADEV
ncbi:hypothetical protein FKP32DRAFT_1679139 [Trametes sanguinea]|nr:hypothetical protein FKP32DRAFT_1679139 [Trametes sanguinea]